MISLTASALFAAPAGARVPAVGAMRASILKAAGSGASADAPCFSVNLAARGSVWAIVQTPVSDEHNPACSDVQLGGYTILRHVNGRWTVVASSDELGCPIVSDPGQPVITGQIVRELTGLHCVQPVVAGHHFPALPTELAGKAGLAVEPREIGFTGDGTGFLGGYTGRSSVRLSKTTRSLPFGDLVWAKWNAQGAKGAGAEWLNNGIPDDAHGTFYPFQATVWAYRPRSDVFTRMKVQSFVNGNPHITIFKAQYIPGSTLGPGYWQWF